MESLVQSVDATLGVRGTNIVSQTQQEQSKKLEGLSEEVVENLEKTSSAEQVLKEALEDLSDDIGDLTATVKYASVDPASYKDFNAQAWSSLEGNIEFSALGSDLANPPMPLDAGTRYTIAVAVSKLSSGLLVTVSVVSGKLEAVFSRYNLTAWKQLA
ncbi:MAG: hypothetical protein ACRDC4_11655 [Plesiomonas sp.]